MDTPCGAPGWLAMRMQVRILPLAPNDLSTTHKELT